MKNFHKVFPLENILIRKKILWRINFVLIKFSPNALLFEKLQNECKNSSVSIKLHVLGQTMQRSCQVLYSWLYTVGGFGTTHTEAGQNVWYICILFGICRGIEQSLHKRIECKFPLKYRRLKWIGFVAQPNAVCLASVTHLH